MRFINYILFVSVFSAFGFMGIVYTVWHNGDAVTRRNIETDVLLFKHALIDQSSELKKWIRKHHGDAAESAVMKKFVKWGLEHQQEFIKIISASTEPDESAAVTDKIAYTIFHGGPELVETFKKSYKDIESKDINQIMSYVKKLQQEKDVKNNTSSD